MRAGRRFTIWSSALCSNAVGTPPWPRPNGSADASSKSASASLPLYSNNCRLCGVDLSTPMLRKAQERIIELGLANVEGLWVMDAEHLSFSDNSFDVVVAQYVITTVPNP